MKNKKTKVVLLGLAIFVFLASGCVNQNKIKELKNEVAQLNQVILQKDAQIKTLTDRVRIKQKELDNVNKKLNTLVAAPKTVKK